MYDRWSLIVKLSDRITVKSYRHVPPISDLTEDTIGVSGIGTSGTLARIRVRAAAPALVEAAGRHAGRLTGGAPQLARAADGDAVAVEDERAIGITARQRR